MTATSYPVARYRFTFEATSPFYVPEFAGSMLRGMFGWSLRKLSVASRFGDLIDRSELYRLCPYTMMFEPPPPDKHQLQKFSNIPSPYVIEPPATGKRIMENGEQLQFNMVLAGHARHQLPYVIAAWKGALAENIGREKGKAELIEVALQTEQGNDIIYNQENPSIIDHEQALQLPPSSDTTSIRIEFFSPLRLQKNGKPLSAKDLNTSNFLMALIRRIGLITEFHSNNELDIDYQHLREVAKSLKMEKNLSWREWERYSNKQKRRMSFGGLVGHIELTGNLVPFLQHLYLGHWLHVGKNTTFGLGGYRIY